jgi:hypothetical protein
MQDKDNAKHHLRKLAEEMSPQESPLHEGVVFDADGVGASSTRPTDERIVAQPARMKPTLMIHIILCVRAFILFLLHNVFWTAAAYTYSNP